MNLKTKMEACFLEGKFQGTCGESRGSVALIRLLDCKDDTRNHLVKYHLGSEQLLEYELILTRAGCDVFVVRFYFVNILYTLAPLTMRSLPNSDGRGVPRDSKIEY